MSMLPLSAARGVGRVEGSVVPWQPAALSGPSGVEVNLSSSESSVLAPSESCCTLFAVLALTTLGSSLAMLSSVI